MPELVQGVWNLEWLISNESLLGRVLHAFVGYESSPALIQVIAYSVYVLVVGRMCMRGAKEIHS